MSSKEGGAPYTPISLQAQNMHLSGMSWPGTSQTVSSSLLAQRFWEGTALYAHHKLSACASLARALLGLCWSPNPWGFGCRSPRWERRRRHNPMVLWGRGCRAAIPALSSPVPNSFAPKHLHTLASVWLVQNAGWQPQNVPRGTGSLAPSPL